MIIRIVCMSFHADGVNEFLQTFEERKQTIASFEGCLGLQLLRDKDNPNVFFTYSKWETEGHLDRYRSSAFFAETWQLAKKHFNARAQAWSVYEV